MPSLTQSLQMLSVLQNTSRTLHNTRTCSLYFLAHKLQEPDHHLCRPMNRHKIGHHQSSRHGYEWAEEEGGDEDGMAEGMSVLTLI